MEPTRAAIAAIHNRVKGEISALLEDLDESSSDETEVELKFRSVTNTALWEAIYTLANDIDRLRNVTER